MLDEIDTDSISPVEALMKLYELKKLLGENKVSDNRRHLKKVVG